LYLIQKKLDNRNQPSLGGEVEVQSTNYEKTQKGVHYLYSKEKGGDLRDKNGVHLKVHIREESSSRNPLIGR